MTEGDKKWIENWKPKGDNVNIGTAKSPKWDSEMKKLKNPLISKLLNLKYKMNEAYRDENNTECVDALKTNKSWVMSLISDVRKNNLTKLCKEDMLKCNGSWKKYE